MVADATAAAIRGAQIISETGRAAVADHGSFDMAMSGGHTPWNMLGALDSTEIPWDQTQIYQVDERIASPGSQDRNLTHMIMILPIERQAILHPMQVTSRDLESAARAYDEELPDHLDLIHLGLGPDGHTASLVPSDPVLEVTDRRVALTGTAYQGHQRMTLTYPGIAIAGKAMFLVTGPDKREALAKLVAGDRTIPAGRIGIDDVVVVADRAAAADLPAD